MTRLLEEFDRALQSRADADVWRMRSAYVRERYAWAHVADQYAEVVARLVKESRRTRQAQGGGVSALTWRGGRMAVGRTARPPVVAVLMSTFNGEAFLEAQLDSLRTQTGVEVRLHVRDDGSTDGTVALLTAMRSGGRSSAGLRSGPNLRPAASFLELLRTAPDDAEYYAYCDQDDVWRPGKLARAVEALAAEARPALYCSNVTCVAEDLTVLGVPRENGDARFQHLLFENIAYGCTTVMNRAARDLIMSRMPERGVVMHDWWCALVVAAFGRVIYDPSRMSSTGSTGATRSAPDANLVTQTLSQAAIFLRNPGGSYRIHGQTTEFLRLFRADLTSDHRARVERLVHSKTSLLRRARYAISGEIVRSHLWAPLPRGPSSWRAGTDPEDCDVHAARSLLAAQTPHKAARASGGPATAWPPPVRDVRQSCRTVSSLRVGLARRACPDACARHDRERCRPFRVPSLRGA